MSRWDYYWNYYTPKPPKPVKDGIKTKSQRGKIGVNWWSRRWLNVLESMGMGARLGRGRSYARRGQVASLELTEGLVNARVQGTRATPYKIRIQMKQLSPADWDKVTDVMAEQAIFMAKLLAGEMPDDIEEAFHQAKISLFPQSMRELVTDCSCPDWANPCKHIAAVYFILAEQFDEDPFLLFKLRGKSKDRLIAELRQKRGALGAEEAENSIDAGDFELSASVPPLSDCLDHFWQAGPDLATLAPNPAPPEVDCALLKRLGQAPFRIGRQNFAELLEKIYGDLSWAALEKALGDASGSD